MFLFGYFPKEWGLTQFNNKKMLPEAIQLLEYQMVVWARSPANQSRL